MRTFRRVALPVGFLSLIFSADCYAQVRVRGYVRRNGTYVSPHFRSAPDDRFFNNWITIGNFNPYTGQPGTNIWPPNGYSRTLSGGGYLRHDAAFARPNFGYLPQRFDTGNWSTLDDAAMFNGRAARIIWAWDLQPNGIPLPRPSRSSMMLARPAYEPTTIELRSRSQFDRMANTNPRAMVNLKSITPRAAFTLSPISLDRPRIAKQQLEKLPDTTRPKLVSVDVPFDSKELRRPLTLAEATANKRMRDAAQHAIHEAGEEVESNSVSVLDSRARQEVARDLSDLLGYDVDWREHSLHNLVDLELRVQKSKRLKRVGIDAHWQLHSLDDLIALERRGAR